MVLHTDEPHPHVHMVVKAISEQGVRLNIRKATLREWRREFARHLRDQGIAANATERAVRGEGRTHKKDGVYRAALRGHSTHMRARAQGIAIQLSEGRLPVERGQSKVLRTRTEVERGWQAVGDILIKEGQVQLAAQLGRFVRQMASPGTERDYLAAAMLNQRAPESVLTR